MKDSTGKRLYVNSYVKENIQELRQAPIANFGQIVSIDNHLANVIYYTPTNWRFMAIRAGNSLVKITRAEYEQNMLLEKLEN